MFGQNKTIITGKTGFLGSSIEKLISDTHKIVDSNSNLIIHCATCYGRNGENESQVIDANYNYPKKLFDDLTDGSIFINIDTILPDDINIYSKSKGMFRDYIKKSKRDVVVINLRLESFYGIGERDDKFITSMVRKILKNETIKLSDGKPKRDFINIEDLMRLFYKILNTEFDIGFHDFHIGTGTPYSIKEVVTLIKEISKSNSNLLFGSLPNRENEIYLSTADISKLRCFQWKPSKDLEEGLYEVIEYERKRL